MFKIKTDLPTPSAAELRAFNCDKEAVRAVIAIKAELVRAIQRLYPFTVASLARQYFPGEPDFHAVSKLGLELTASLQELAAHGEDCGSVLAAADAEIAPLMATAARRHLQITGEILPRINVEIATYERRTQEKRKLLEKAGVAGDELERLLADKGIGGLIAKKAVLTAENDGLVLFMKTKDERHLPPGFKAEAPRHEPADWPRAEPQKAA